MAASYIPPTDAGFVDWITNFSDLITLAPATYGLDATAALAIQGEADAFNAAYTLAVNPGTRTPVTVAAKDSARVSANGVVRTYAAQIRINPGVTNEDKIDLGLNLPNNAGSPIPAPTTFPMLTFLSGAPLTHQWSYKDSGTPTVKAKAAGAVQMILYASASATPIVDPLLLTWKQVVTKSPFLVEWDSADVGKMAYYAARWVTRRGLLSPWSAISSATVVGT